ncbi:unnamed protein product [Cercopithifilaria johnstoni]|uniref:ZP domain-containing protein n=1 Tax=Cercopithifilaria johnstoni TaxID=2874296 RepID=A0A8J2LV08_9BILA|nr:unnamed protein product [Cercopithifilaria johnstoni]
MVFFVAPLLPLVMQSTEAFKSFIGDACDKRKIKLSSFMLYAVKLLNSSVGKAISQVFSKVTSSTTFFANDFVRRSFSFRRKKVERPNVDVSARAAFANFSALKNDESDDPNCVTSYYGDEQQLYALDRSSTNSKQQLRFSLKFGECNMRRQRTLNPRGVAYAFTLIVSFHPIFETEVDRAYRVRCFFTESVKALEATIGVRTSEQSTSSKRIHSNDSLKLSEISASEMKVAEMDLTARVVVLPLVEVHLSNASLSNSN